MPSTTPTSADPAPAPRAAIRSFLRCRVLRQAVTAFTFAALVSGPAPRAQEDDAAAGAGAAAPTAPGAPAAAAAPGGTVSLAFSGAPIERVLDSITRQTGLNVVARGKVAGQQVSILVRDEPVEGVLQKLVNQKPDWLLFRPEEAPGTIEIWDQATYKQEILPKLVRQKVFVPRNITAEEAAKALEGIKTPNIGAIAFDPRSNKVIMTDQPYVLEIAQRLLEQIDVDYITRVFYVAHADVNEMSEKLNNLKSPAAPPIEVDVRTHYIIVRDRLENLRKMELLIETLDRGPDIRVYDLNNIGVEGEDATALQEALDRIITPEAFYQINVRASKLILEDIPEVHEKVEKLLAALDQPIKQVLIQAEIIETEFSESFNYSFDAVLSQDLFASVIDGLTGIQELPFDTNLSEDEQPGFFAGGGIIGSDETPARFGGVPVSSRRGAVVDQSNLGFLNFRDEFPIARVGGSGLDASFLTRSAYITLRAAMSDTRTRILQQPRVLVENQKPVLLVIGQELPYFTGGAVYNSVGTGGGVVQQSGQPVQQRLSVGLELEMIPVISNNGLVELEVLLTNSTPIFREEIFGGQEYTGTGSNDQELETVLVIPSGETRVIGGLITDSKSETKSGIPYLTNIPVIGPLFGSVNRPSEDNRRRNLLIFLTPTVVVEEPKPPAMYKGRAFEQEDIALLPPDATLTDIDIEPAPLGLELPPDMPGKAPYDGLEIPAAPESAVPGTDPLAPALQLDTTLPPVPVEPPLDLEPVNLDPLGPAADAAGAVPLQRIRVTDRPDTAAAMMSRIPAPAGGINLGGATSTVGAAPSAAIPAPVTASSPGGPGAPGAPGAGAPIAVAPAPGGRVTPTAPTGTPLPTPPAAVATAVAGAPIATPVAPAVAETRF